MSRVVCVTGASGFVATYLVEDLLKHGYRVRGTVRSLASKDKYSHLLKLQNADKNLELVEADLLKEGSFDQAVKGCECVFHTASPFFFGATDPQKQLIDPALNGTRNVFSSVAKNLDTVKRVVVTSSVAAIYHPTNSKPGLYTEEDWNTGSSLTDQPYAYSKVLAEKEAWKLASESKVSLTTINPPFIFGPVLALDRVKDESELNTSNSYLKGFLSKKSDEPASLTAGFNLVDVRDVATAHRLAFENDVTIGQRLIVSAAAMSQARFSLELQRLFPQYKDKIPSKIEFTDEIKSVDDGEKQLRVFSSEKIQKLLPTFKFTSVDDTLRDTVASLEKSGLLKN